MKYLFLMGCSFIASIPAAAQTKTSDEVVLVHRIRDDLITVVASGQPDRLTRSGQSISISPMPAQPFFGTAVVQRMPLFGYSSVAARNGTNTLPTIV